MRLISWRPATLVGALLVFAASTAGGTDCRQGVAPRTELGRRHALVRHVTPVGMTEISGAAPGDTPAYVRPLLELVQDAPGEDWYLVVRDGSARPVQTLTAAEFRATKRRWTTRIDGPRAWLQLYARPASPVRVDVVEYLAMPARAVNRYYSVKSPGSPTWVPLYGAAAAADAKPLGDAVGMLMSAFGESVWCCSGVLVAPDLLLTNWHCGGDDGAGMTPQGFWSEEVCRGTLVDFSWDEDGVSREYVCHGVVASSRALDYALLRVAPVSDLGGIPPVVAAAGAPAPGQPLYLIHHPECLPKRLSDCKVVAVQQTGWFAEDGQPARAVDFTHRCDTEGGSSGAPVFAGGKVVGLHHLGYRLDDACHPVDDVNKAVSMQEIVADLRQRAPQLAARLRVE